MRISANGIALIKEFEGCFEKRADGHIHAYLCPAGVPTIG
jgi:GH24 family phage-related lysozyme (muramidase)